MKIDMEKFARFLVVTFVPAALLLVNAFFFEWLWNTNVPGIFGLKEITFVNAVGFFVMFNLVKNQPQIGFLGE